MTDLIESSEIERMSVTQRLQAMDQLWESHNRWGDEVLSPDWHQDVEVVTGVPYGNRAILDLRRQPLWIRKRLQERR